MRSSPIRFLREAGRHGRLALVAETLRAALNALAVAAPDWLVQITGPDWFKRYATRVEDSRFPQTRARRDEVGRRIGTDGMRLLGAVTSPDAPGMSLTTSPIKYRTNAIAPAAIGLPANSAKTHMRSIRPAASLRCG